MSGTSHHANEAPHYKHSEFLKLISFVDFTKNQFNAFDKFPDQHAILDVHFISVCADYRRKGIAENLIRHTWNFTKQQNIGLCQMGCTSYYSARLCVKMDFEQCYEIDYKNYIVDGKNPLEPLQPHEKFRLFVKKL